MTSLIQQFSPTSDLRKVIESMLAVWPEHLNFLNSRFGAPYAPLQNCSERVAKRIVAIAGDELEIFCNDYRWTCDLLLEELLYFYRHKEYRVKTFAEAYSAFYGNETQMVKYNHGLLLSQLLWANQTAAIDMYLEKFLSKCLHGGRHLEIGPGHGLLLAEAALNDRAGTLVGWDASQASLNASNESLRRMGVNSVVKLEKRDLRLPLVTEAPFDSIVMSEILEHIEEPAVALAQVEKITAKGGRIFVNVPANSPAPDHIFMIRNSDELVSMIKAAGFTPVNVETFPQTGYSLKEAQQLRATVSCVVIAEK